MGLRSDHPTGRSWSPVGQTPIVEGTGQRFGTNVISAISNKVYLQFRVFKQRFTAPVFIDLLGRLIRQADGQEVILILNGPPVHRAKNVRRWVELHDDQIELQFLPGYSPELNPTELLNQDVKSNALGRRRPGDQDELIDDTRPYLRSTQRCPHLVARYFDEEHVTYAKAACRDLLDLSGNSQKPRLLQDTTTPLSGIPRPTRDSIYFCRDSDKTVEHETYNSGL